jgi:prolyl-tRNA synthetase
VAGQVFTGRRTSLRAGSASYGPVMFKLIDRHDRELGLGPTQEEAVTPLVAGDVHSYRDLPLNLYQVEWKYRDEFRPRYGLLRVREFLMKDAYSFDRDDEGMHRSYGIMMDAYRRIFDRCGVQYVVVEADPGTIGGGTNQEFMAMAEIGEDLYVICRTATTSQISRRQGRAHQPLSNRPSWNR